MTIRVLVIVPSFPSLNQPWIDTYLESLLREGVEFTVLSSVLNPHRYHEKVTRLGLLNHVRHYFFQPRRWMQELLKVSLRRPVRTTRSLRFAWLESGNYEASFRGRIKTALWSAYLADVIARAGPFDIVHVHFEDTALGFEIPVRETGRPMVMTFHGLPPKDVPQLDDERRRYLYSRLAGVFVNTERAKAFVKRSGCPEEIIRVVPQGLPLDDFPFRPIQPPARGETLTLLSVGRFNRDKGHAHALLAACRLVRHGIRIHWRLVGAGPEAEIRRLRRLITRLGLEDSVEMVFGAELEQLRAWYTESHILVLASIEQGPEHLIETQGVVVQEAQAIGCIPVVTATGGVPECVRHGVDAMVVAPGSSRAIYDAVVWLMEHQERWVPMTEAARENVEERFCSTVIGRRMTRLLNEFSGVRRRCG